MVIRGYLEGDEQGLISLLSSLGWRHLGSRENWEWEFLQCPDGPALIQVAEHDGEIIGQYSSLALAMQCGPRIVHGGKAEGSAVDARYRGAAARKFFPGEKRPTVFGKLIEGFFASADEHGKMLIWGFPNAAALNPQVRYGYDYIQVPQDLLILPLHARQLADPALSTRISHQGVRHVLTIPLAAGICTLTWLRRRPYRSLVEGLRVHEISEFDQRMDGFWDACRQERSRITIVRNQRYLNWRFVSNPNATYTRLIAELRGDVVGYLVTSVIKRPEYVEGHVVDVMVRADHHDALCALIGHAVERLRRQGAALISVWTIRDNSHHVEYDRAFRRLGFWRRRPSALHLIVRAQEECAPRAYVLDSANWYITMAFTEGTL